jgi:hypothetical protein
MSRKASSRPRSTLLPPNPTVLTPNPPGELSRQPTLRRTLLSETKSSQGLLPFLGFSTRSRRGLICNGLWCRYESVPGSYPSFYTALGKAIRGQGEPPVKVEESIELIRVLELAHQSSREGRTLDV